MPTDVSALLPQPGGFEGFRLLLEHPKASDLPALDRVHERAPRHHLDPLAAAKVGGVRDDDLRAHLREAVRLDLDIAERRHASQKASSSL